MNLEKDIDLKRIWLSNLLEAKISKNSRFSLRAFAKKVDVNPGVLSRILSGKRSLSFKMAMKIADAFDLNDLEKDELISLYTKKELKKDEIKILKEIDQKDFAIIKEWYHYAIAQMIKLDNFQEDYSLISKSLGISSEVVKSAISSLLSLNILARDDKGKLYRTATHLTTYAAEPSSSIRFYQKQILNKVILSLENDNIDERDITSITVAIDESKILEAKEEIRKFRQKMADFMSNGQCSRVYNLAISLIPLSN